MKNCRVLYEYAEFVYSMRAHLENAKTQEEEIMAADAAIEACIRDGILVEFLNKHRVVSSNL